MSVDRPDVGCTAVALDSACTNGFLDIAQRLHAAGKPATVASANGALAGGHIDVLKFLHRYA